MATEMTGGPAEVPILKAAAAFRGRAANAKGASSICDDQSVELSYEEEIARINRDAAALRATEADSSGSGGFLPALYLRGRDPMAEEVLRLLRETSKSFELNLRFHEVEKLDRMHAKLWELLREGGRTCITVDQYKTLIRDFDAWAKTEFGVEAGTDLHRCDDAANANVEAEERPSINSSAGRIEKDEGRAGAGGGSPTARLAQPTSGNKRSPRRRPTASQSLQRPVDDATALGDVLYLSNVRPPRPTMELFLSCPRSNLIPTAVDIAVIYQLFSKKVSLVKCEAELIMWDTNNDGRLSEDEMENYVRDLVPRMDALRNMPQEVLPFYCCTASRRLFWDLDPGNRGVVRLDTLLQSSVMDEWVSLQLLTEDNPRNWFGAMATQQLYEKFLLLDSRNEGTLNADNLKRYKKGLPTVLDDGLPIDISPLCTLFIDRFFETNVMMAKSEMDYRKFVDFVIAVEMLPQCSRPVFLWNIVDLHGDGVLTPMTANYFFRETHAKLVSAGLEVPAKETVIQEAFDLIPSAEPLRITREEFIASPQAGLFVALLVDCLSFWAYENREQR